MLTRSMSRTLRVTELLVTQVPQSALASCPELVDRVQSMQLDVADFPVGELLCRPQVHTVRGGPRLDHDGPLAHAQANKMTYMRTLRGTSGSALPGQHTNAWPQSRWRRLITEPGATAVGRALWCCL